MKRIALLGSTGSIGESTLKVARHLKDRIQVTALAAKSNIDLLEQQAREFNPDLIGVYDSAKAIELQKRLPHLEVVGGAEGLEAVASHHKADFVLSAMSGTCGLLPTLIAIKAGKQIGLANKEALVSGGALITGAAKTYGVELIPVDSEHSAIFQCLRDEKKPAVHRIILTASGGPFRTFTQEQILAVTVDQALRHPTWNMGPKVTIDCSTLMNKGLEVIEAYWLFDIPLDKIEVIIHPQSIIHSMVEFVNHSILAQMGDPSMTVPIQYAMTYPERIQGFLKPFDFMKYGTLQFFPPDFEKFRCLRLAYEAVKEGGTLAAYMNAANETLVHRFLDRQISWQEISSKLEQLMSAHQTQNVASIDDVLSVDALAKEEAQRI